MARLGAGDRRAADSDHPIGPHDRSRANLHQHGRPLPDLTPFFQGTLPGGPTNPLPAGGLLMLYPVLADRTDRWGRLGDGMACLATVASAVGYSLIGTPCLQFKVAGIGPDLILLARAGGTCPSCACETERR